MKVVCNRKNLKAHVQSLLGNEYSPESASELIRVCLTGFEKQSGHISHSRQAHLEKINKVLHTHGVEGMLLDRKGNDVSGSCDPLQVAVDIQYCNAGDTYALTIMYVNGKLCIGDWGCIVERLS